MSVRWWNRYVGIAGILSVVLMVSGGIALNSLPSHAGDAAKVALVIANSRSSAAWGGFLLLIAMIPFVLFAVGVIDPLSRDVAISRILRRVSFGSAIVTVALYATYQGLIGALVNVSQSSTAETVRAVYAISGQIVTVGALFLGLFVLTTSMLALGLGVLPRWVRWLGVVGGLTFIVAALDQQSSNDALGAVYPIGWYLSQAWILVTGVCMFLGGVRAENSGDERAPTRRIQPDPA